MIIEILGAKKQLRQCNLKDSVDCTYLKGIVTRCINKSDYIKLEDLQKKFAQCRTNTFAASQLDRINTALNNKPTDVFIQTNMTTYNLNIPARQKALQATIKRYYKAGKTHEIQLLEKQVNKSLKKHEGHLALKEIKSHIEKRKHAQQQTQNYQPYTTILAKEFTLQAREPSMIQQQGYDIDENNLTKYEYDDNIIAYLERTVITKRKIGQDNVEELTASFWFDYLNNLDFFTEDEDELNFVMLLVAIRTFYSHNASYYPSQGYGKSSLEGCESPLFYLRSQTKHHDVKNYTNYHQGNGVFGPQNSQYIRFIKHMPFASTSYSKKMEKITQEGDVIDVNSLQGYGTSIIHAGTRANNVELYKSAMEDALVINPDKDKLQALLKTHSSIVALKTKKCSRIYRKLSEDTAKLLDGFASLQGHAKLKTNPQLYSTLMRSRSHSAQLIAEKLSSKKLKHMKVSHPAGSNFVYIDLYPERFSDDIKASDNIKQGLTNVLLGFLTGLINHNAQQSGFFYFIQRRQSFGFLRSTVTDAGSLRVRLSLDINPQPFEQLIIDSIKAFDKILNDFNFVVPSESKSKNKDLVAKTISVSEESKGKVATKKTGVYNLSAMRVEDDQWIAILISQKYLQDSETPQEAFQKYLKQFVIQRVEHNKVEESDHYKLSRKGYTSTSPTLRVKSAQEIEINHYPIFLLLQNVVTTTISYINSLKEQTPSSILFYILKKLYHNCQKGLAILSNLNNYEVSHLIAKAALLIENIQEYLIPLRCLVDDINASKNALKEIETSRFADAVKVPSEQTKVFYNDGGQQAVNTAIMAMFRQGMKSIYLFPDCYYEIPLFCSEAGFDQTNTKRAEIWFCDITQSDNLRQALKLRIKVKAVIIDITNNSSTESLESLNDIIKTAQENNIILVLSCSTLKHEQLCQDKYQSGRNVFILPKAVPLNTYLEEHLQNISDEAMPPLLASFRQTVETTMQEAPEQTLQAFGLFSQTKIEKDVTTEVDSKETPVLTL